MHESFTRDDKVRGSSDRTFGLVMAAFFALIAAAPLLRHGRDGHVRWLPAAAAALFATVAMIRPAALAPLNRLCMKVGLLLNRITSPIVLAVLFFGVFTPFSLVLRAIGKRPIATGFDPSATTYWLRTPPPDPTSANTMSRQF